MLITPVMRKKALTERSSCFASSPSHGKQFELSSIRGWSRTLVIRAVVVHLVCRDERLATAQAAIARRNLGVRKYFKPVRFEPANLRIREERVV